MKAILLLVGLMLSLLLVIQIILAPEQTNTPPAQITFVQGAWQTYPTTLVEARKLSVAIVVAEVTAVQQAPDTVVPEASLPEGEHRHPNRRVSFEVSRLLRGNVENQFKIWQFGNDVMQLEDDPPYQVGDTYVLFLRPVDNEPGTYVPVGPPGRFRVANDKLEIMPGVDDVPFAATLAGKPVSVLEQALVLDESKAITR